MYKNIKIHKLQYFEIKIRIFLYNKIQKNIYSKIKKKLILTNLFIKILNPFKIPLKNKFSQQANNIKNLKKITKSIRTIKNIKVKMFKTF